MLKDINDKAFVYTPKIHKLEEVGLVDWVAIHGLSIETGYLGDMAYPRHWYAAIEVEGERYEMKGETPRDAVVRLAANLQGGRVLGADLHTSPVTPLTFNVEDLY